MRVVVEELQDKGSHSLQHRQGAAAGEAVEGMAAQRSFSEASWRQEKRRCQASWAFGADHSQVTARHRKALVVELAGLRPGSDHPSYLRPSSALTAKMPVQTRSWLVSRYRANRQKPKLST